MRRLIAIVLAVLPLVAGCAVANKAVRANYSSYNETIHYNQSQQMLLNLVRLKYRELPLFLKVGALSTSYSYAIDGSANLGATSPGNSKALGVGVGTSYSSRPTITYTPLEGDTFVKQVLSEIDPDGFILLVRSGWPIDMLSYITVEKIGDDLNNENERSYPRFRAIVETLREAQRSGNLKFVREENGDAEDGEEQDMGEWFLELTTDRVDVYGVERGEWTMHRVAFSAFQLRSFLDIMFFLGKNTRVPDAHLDQVKHSDGNEWIDIRWSADEPDDAVVAVRHNDYWFSIGKSDIQSKDTFSLTKLLYQMQAGDVKTVQPVLTLPVAQP